MKIKLLISFLLLPILESQTENATIQQIQTEYRCIISHHWRDDRLVRVLFPIEVAAQNNKDNEMKLVRINIKQKRDWKGWGPELIIHEKRHNTLYSDVGDLIKEIDPLQTKKYVFYTFHEVYKNKKFQKVFESYADSMRKNGLKKVDVDYRKLTTKQLKALRDLLKGDSLRIDYITFTDTGNVRSRVKFPIQTDLILPKQK